MSPYFIILIIVTLLAFFAKKIKKSSFFFNFLILIILTCFAGLRSLKVGADTSGYAHNFESINTDYNNFIYFRPNIEIGYSLLEYVTSLFSNSYVTILTVVALIALYFQLESIKKLSKESVISIFVFITFGIYTFIFNGARQGIAAAIFMYALTFLIGGQFWKYLLLIIIAWSFHKSVIIAIPLYFVFRIKFTKKWFLLLLTGSITTFYLFRSIISFSGIINSRYLAFLFREDQGGQYLTLCYTMLSIFFITIRSKIKEEYKFDYDIYLNMFLFSTIIYILVYLSGAYIEITRIGFYFLTSAVFIWPLIFKSFTQKKSILLLLGFAIFQITYFYIYLDKIGGLLPYYLNNDFF